MLRHSFAHYNLNIGQEEKDRKRTRRGNERLSNENIGERESACLCEEENGVVDHTVAQFKQHHDANLVSRSLRGKGICSQVVEISSGLDH